MLIIDVLLSGVAAGLMSSVLGIGGGVVIVPVLSVLFGFSQHEAIATSLLAIAMITAVNVWRFQLKKMLPWSVVLLIAFFAAAASFAAGLTGTYLPQEMLILLFILFLLFMIVNTFLIKENPKAQKNSSKLLLATKIGLTTGVVSGLTGVGGGLIATPLLLSSPSVKNEQAVPVSNGVMLFTTFFAVLAFMFASSKITRTWQVGYVHLDIAFFTFLGALPSAWLGTKIQHSLSLTLKKSLLLIFILIVLIRMVIKLYILPKI